MPSARSLHLRRESLAPLTTEDMAAVVGGSHLCGVTDNCGETLTHGPSIDVSCPSAPVTDCIDDIRISRRICS